jgi:hypothetical protein
MLKRLLVGLIVAVMMTGAAVAGSDMDGQVAYFSGDYATALKVWRPLAEQGDAPSQNMLGILYEAGQGVPQDYAEALRWFQLAAERGDPSAQNNLGSMYEDGEGVAKNYVLAHMWFNLAAARDPYPVWRDLYAHDRDEVARLMTPDQIAEAQRLAREWKPKPP